MGYRPDNRLANLAAILFLGSLVFPSSISIGAGALTLPRIALVTISIPLLLELFRKITRGGYVPIASDIFVPAMTLWILVSLCLNEGVKSLTGYGALSAIEFVISYFLGRVYFGTLSGFERFIRVLKVVILAITIISFMDTLSGQHFTWAIGRSISGGPTEEIAAWRFGLIRAQGPLEHPILLGVFIVVCLLMLWHSSLQISEKIFWSIFGLVGVLLPLSSAPILSLIISLSLIILIRVLGIFPWGMLFSIIFVSYILAIFMLLVDNPLSILIKNLTFDPQTGFYRVTIWQWAAYNVRRAPWIGTGFTDWVRGDDMSSTMDSLYLVQSVRYGLPAVVLLLLSMVCNGITMPLRAQIYYYSPKVSSLRRGLAVAIFVLFFNAFTVHFWGSIWMLLAVVIGLRAGLTESMYLHPYTRGEQPISGLDRGLIQVHASTQETSATVAR